jgi:hypothetical protein
MAHIKPNSGLCSCNNKNLVEISKTPFNYNSDAYVTTYQSIFYECPSCKNIFVRYYGDDGKFDGDYTPYSGRLTKKEIIKIAPEGGQSIMNANMQKTLDKYKSLKQRRKLTPELEKSLLHELGLNNEHIINLENSIKNRGGIGEKKYHSIFEYYELEVLPMYKNFAKSDQIARNRMNRILGR